MYGCAESVVALGLHAAVEVIGGQVREHVHVRVEQRQVDVPADARLLDPTQGREDGERTHDTRGVVDDRDAVLRRLAARVAGQAHHPRQGLDQVVVRGQVAFGPCGAEARQRAGDEARVHPAQGLRVCSESFHDPQAEVVDHDLRGLDEAIEGRTAGLALQVEGDASLAAVEAVEVRGLALDPAAGHGAAEVGVIRRLDLDHVGAQVGEEERAVRTCEVVRQLEHP